MRSFSVSALAAFWLLVFSSPADAFDVIQITNNSTHDIWPDPSISFGGVALLAGLVLGTVAWARRAGREPAHP